MTECAELELGLLPAENGCYTLDFRFWRPGSAVSISLGPPAPAPFTIDIAALRLLSADALAYGKQLSSFVFSSPGSKEALAQARTIAATLAVPLRLRLYLHPSTPAELRTLRWETLGDPSGASLPLTMQESLLFSRFLLSDNPQPFAPPQRPRLKALVVVSNPFNLAQAFVPLNVAEELEKARSGLAGMDLQELPSGGKATLENLLDGLRQGVDVLYLVAHGGLHKQTQKTFVLLEKSDGYAQPIFTADFVNRMGDQLPLFNDPGFLSECWYG